MRIDKFLKVSRIIKRRSVSKDIVSFGQVKINNRVAKPSTSIKIGDIVELSLGSKIITIEIMSIDEKVKIVAPIESARHKPSFSYYENVDSSNKTDVNSNFSKILEEEMMKIKSK